MSTKLVCSRCEEEEEEEEEETFASSPANQLFISLHLTPIWRGSNKKAAVPDFTHHSSFFPSILTLVITITVSITRC